MCRQSFQLLTFSHYAKWAKELYAGERLVAPDFGYHECSAEVQSVITDPQNGQKRCSLGLWRRDLPLRQSSGFTLGDTRTKCTQPYT